MTRIAIYPGAERAWLDAEACEVQAEAWLMDEAKLRLVNRVVELARGWDVQSVLDIGCGSGQYCGALGVPRYVGIDQSEAMLRAARFGPNADFIRGAAEDVALTERFDLGLVMHVVQHTKNAKAFLRLVLGKFHCNRWVFTMLTVSGTRGRTFNIGEYQAAYALPLAKAQAMVQSLGLIIEGTELDPSVGVRDAQELLVWGKVEWT